MVANPHELRGFRIVFCVVGVIYSVMASSMLVRGVTALHEFGVPERLTSEPVLQDYFYFFFQLMAVIGLLMVLFGVATRDRRSQLLVSSVFCVLNILSALRDLSTSDSRFGNHLYRGDKTLVFVFIGLALAAVFGTLALTGLRTAPK